MSIRDKLDEFLDIEDTEKDTISFIVLGERIKSTKLDIARAIANAETFELVDNTEGASKWMKAARASTVEYKHFLTQHKELEVRMSKEQTLSLSENSNHG